MAATARRPPGRRDSTSFMNPVVRYPNRGLDIGGKLEVGAGGTKLLLQPGGRLKEVALPLAVQGFLDCLHRGLYPSLETVG